MSGNRLLRSTAVFSSMTFISRVSGLVRDQVYAAVFGAGPAMDAFVVAFRIPNFMRRLSAEGSFSMAFVPVLAEYKAKGDQEAVKALIDRVAGTLSAFLLVLVAVAVLAAPWVVRLFAPGFSVGSEQALLATEMLRITFPYVLFISLASMAGGILNSYQRFAIPALSPVLMNLSMIAAALGLVPLMAGWGYEPVVALAWGVFAAGILQLAFHLPSLARLGVLPRPRWGGADPGVRKIMKLMVPTLFGASVAQINLLINTIMASFLICFTISFDEFIISNFLGSGQPILSVYIFGQFRFPAKVPSMLALGTVLVLFSIILLGVAEYFRRRGIAKTGGKDSGGFL